MIAYLLKRPIAVLTIFFCVCATGIITYLKLPVALMPDLESPKLVIKVVYDGYGASYIEENILTNLRNTLSSLYGLKNIESMSSNNTGQISLDFDYGTDMKLAFIEANEKIDQTIISLPNDMDRPQVYRISDTDIPVMKVQLQSDMELTELTELTDYVIKRRIEGVPGVARVTTSGGAERVIAIHPYPERLKGTRVSEEDLIQILKDANFSQLEIKVKEGIYAYTVRVENLLKSQEAIKSLKLKINDKELISLDQLASVTYEAEEAQGIHWYNGKEGIVIDIHRQASTNMQRLEADLLQSLDQMQKEFPQIHFAVTQNQTGLLQMSISQLTSSLILGAVLSFLILFTFSANFKLPLLMGVTIPATVILTFLLFYLLDLSINIITLSGLILGVGMLIDNAIILLDNIHVYHQEGLSLANACRKGTEDVFAALLSSTFTTLSVFLPLIFIGGVGGVFFGQQALSLGAMLMASLLVAFLLLPVLYYKLSPRPQQDSSRLYQKILNGYERTHAKPTIPLLLITLITLAGAVVICFIPVSNLPELHTDSASLQLIWPDPVTVEENERRARELVNVLDSTLQEAELDVGINELDPATATFVNSLTAYFAFKNDAAKKANMEVLSQYLHTSYPGTVYTIGRAVNPFDQLFRNETENLEARLRVSDGRTLKQDDLQNVAENTRFKDGFVLQKGLYLHLRQERLDRIHVTPSSLVNQIKYYFQNQVVTEIQKVDRKETIQLSRASKGTIHQINQIILSDDSLKNRYPVSYFFDWEEIILPQFVTADLAGKYQSLAYTGKNNESQWMEKVKKWSIDHKVMAEFSGGYFSKNEHLMQLLMSLILAILLLYFILAAQFESLKQPLIIIITLPAALCGSTLALFLAGYSFNLSSMIGIIVTLGIIVNDSILKIDTINRMHKEGMPLEEAIMAAGTLRLKPILMTSLTTILALIPLLFSKGIGADLQSPLAVTVIGGLSLGTACSIYLIPLIYRKLH